LRYRPEQIAQNFSPALSYKIAHIEPKTQKNVVPLQIFLEKSPLIWDNFGMSECPKVILLLETSRAYGRQLQLGITKYTYFHGPWTFYREPGGRDRALPKLENWKANGIIAHVKNARMGKKILEMGIPAIVKGYRVPGVPIILTDNEAIGKMAAEHLLGCGFRHFAYCGYDNLYWSKERGKAFAKRIAEAKSKTHFYKQPKTHRQRLWDNEINYMTEWLKSLPKPVGLMACVDDRSQHVLQACQIASLEVPSDVAIIGVDNDELVCKLSNPQLSSVALAAERAGYEAAELMDKLMAGERIENPTVVTRPTHVETRQSTNILATENVMVAKAVQFIRQHSNESIQVADVVEAVPLSRRSLQLQFQRVLGHSILEEIRRTRIEQIAEMLHVARFFRKEKGMSPLAYRKLYGPK
jgi:LacI family transcriptional regulator